MITEQKTEHQRQLIVRFINSTSNIYISISILTEKTFDGILCELFCVLNNLIKEGLFNAKN